MDVAGSGRIVVTGGAGFIGSVLLWKLNCEGVADPVVVDSLGEGEQWRNLVGKACSAYLDRAAFRRMVLADAVPFDVSAIVHLGACSSTTERDADYLMDNNYRYTLDLAEWCHQRGVRFIYASSAAVYGDGSGGYEERRRDRVLRPLNAYGFSKLSADLDIGRRGLPATGLRFFNVYGPNEYHKGEMQSVVRKAWQQAKSGGSVRLFRSYRDDYPDGGQMRDFVYAKDCVEVIWWFIQHHEAVGVFNVGSGEARCWSDLARAVFAALGAPPCIEYIDMPEALRAQYQYRTEADLTRLRSAGCDVPFRPLEEGVRDYVQNYLERDTPYL